MNLINGTYSLLYIRSDDVFYPISCLNNNSFSENTTMNGTSTRRNPNGWKTSIPIIQGYSINFSGVISLFGDEQQHYGYGYLEDLKRNRTEIQ
jgi:hypothetical protein